MTFTISADDPRTIRALEIAAEAETPVEPQYDPARRESRPNGYLFPYGDYQGIDIVPGNNRAVMVWGEGWNYAGGPAQPGHVIFRTLPL